MTLLLIIWFASGGFNVGCSFCQGMLSIKMFIFWMLLGPLPFFSFLTRNKDNDPN